MTEENHSNIKDPLSFFIEHRGKPEPGKPFMAGEHIWLANEGADIAINEFRLDKSLLASIKRKNANERLSYGEIVALSGDFYATPEDLFEEKPSPISWLYEENDLSDLLNNFKEELSWIRDDEGKNATNYPDNNISLWWNAKSYLELALNNTEHFGWHNMKTYVHYHAKALDLAIRADANNKDQLRDAIYTNAFADHFLSDAFAAGHVRVPRKQIRDWAKVKGYSDELAGAFSKLLHDQDGHVNTFHSHGESGRPLNDGLAVLNANGKRWFTHCDGQLFLPPKADQTDKVLLPIQAIAESLKELLNAWKKKELPKGIYEATRYVAFPDPKHPSLISKFPNNASDEKIKQLLDSVAWYSRNKWLKSDLNAKNLREFFSALPSLMEKFRLDVKHDFNQQPELSKRLAKAYIEGYLKVE